jgi:hypothetical protein
MHKPKKSEMRGSNVANKYASAVTKNLGLGVILDRALQAISLSVLVILYYPL